MTVLYLALTAAVAFGFGWLLGEHRAVREANTILDANNRLLLQTIGESARAPVEGERQRPVVH